MGGDPILHPLFALLCGRCAGPYPATGLPPFCPRCGGFWIYGDEPGGFAWRPPAGPPYVAGLAAWSAAFGLEPGELPARAAGRPPEALSDVLVAHEGSEPGASFKERGAEVLAAACARRGLREVFLDSSGNAGLALARAARARDITCRVLVPETTPADKLARIEAAGARLEVVPGDRRAAAEAARALVPSLPYASHVVQPFFQAGVATLAWDLAEALGPRAIERVLLPAGNGSLLLGLALGFDRLHAAGRLARRPALHAVQLSGYASLAAGGPGVRMPGPPTAAGIAIEQPARRDEMAAAVAAGGDVTVVDEAEIARARAELAAAGHPTDATGATAWAGLAKRPDLDRAGTVVILTSRGDRG